MRIDIYNSLACFEVSSLWVFSNDDMGEVSQPSLQEANSHWKRYNHNELIIADTQHQIEDRREIKEVSTPAEQEHNNATSIRRVNRSKKG